jgi:HlyD family secretion protein
VVFLTGGIGGWAAMTEVSGAVIAPGRLVVESNVKKVQHATGGIVSTLSAREGAYVTAGDVVVRLDDTQARASLQIVLKELDELLARRAREETEQQGGLQVEFPSELLTRTDDPDVARIISGERRLFQARLEARNGQKAQLRERMAQLEDEVGGLTEQMQAKDSQLELISRELEGVRQLWSKNLVQLSRLSALERDAAQLKGERGQLVASKASSKGKVAETELQILQVDQDMRSEVGKDLSEVRAKIAELSQRRIAAEDELRRIDIRAPQSGYVHQLDVHTVGGVIKPGDTIMEIVPSGDKLAVEVRIQPADINQLRVGQSAALRFSGLNQRTTPEVNGQVTRISPDVAQDQRTGLSYFVVQIGLPEAEIDRLAGLKLVPGMPVEAFIQTQTRTLASYLVEPLQDQISRSFREK